MKKTICLLLALVMLFCTSCSNQTSTNDPNEFTIVTSFYPVYVTTANIIDGADGVELVNLTNPDLGCLHKYMLTPEDMKVLKTADLFIISGMGMEVFMEKSTLGLPKLELLDCGEDITNELGDEDRFNPHYWMDIQNAIEQCEKIKKNLCLLDPDNAEIYEKNAAEYIAKLQALVPEITERAAKLEKKDMIVLNESFDYFADRFGFNIVAVLRNHKGEVLPSKQLSEVVNYMKGNNIKAVFTQKGVSEDDVLKTVQKQTGCTVYELDCITTGSLGKNAKDAYINAVKKNMQTLEKALG